MVDRLPVDRFEPDPGMERIDDGGGSALNTACALSSAGWSVVAVGRVGDDPDGMAAVAALERRGIDARIEIIRGRTTKRNHLYVERSTAATAFEAIIPLMSVEPWEIPPPELEEAKILLLDRLGVMTVGWLATRRERPDLLNALNRNTPGRLGLSDPRFREALPHLDYLQLPEQAAAVPQPAGPPSGLQRGRPPSDPRRIHIPRPFDPLTGREVASLLEAGVRILTLTRGAAGAVVHTRLAGPLPVPAVATRVVDPTGAGDAFAAGFLDSLLRGAGPGEAGSHAADWAARACRYLGARAWLDHEPPGA